MEQTNEMNLLQTIIDGILTLLSLGGPVVAILLLASIFGLALAFKKFLQYSNVGNQTLQKLHDAIDRWQSGEKNRQWKFLMSRR